MRSEEKQKGGFYIKMSLKNEDLSKTEKIN